MNKRGLYRVLGVMLVLMVVGIAVAQRGGGGRGRGGGGGGGGGGGRSQPGIGSGGTRIGSGTGRAAVWAGEGGGQILDLSVIGNGVDMWDVTPGFDRDAFTFVRIAYTSTGRSTRGRGWSTDYPSSELNFSFRLQQLTSLKVNPVPIAMRLTDESLQDYPFIYMLEVGALRFTEEEVGILRHYLLNGGFLLVEDHWGDYEYENFYREIKRVFPDREPQELSIEHPIFHCVFDLKSKPQIPSVRVAEAGRSTGTTWEGGADTVEPHFRAINDDKGRMMALICTNTDLGDGWEREGDNEWYFHEFSEKKGYPMGVNIVFYAMTH